MAAVEDMALVLSRARWVSFDLSRSNILNKEESSSFLTLVNWLPQISLFRQQNRGRTQNEISHTSKWLKKHFVKWNGEGGSRREIPKRRTRSPGIGSEEVQKVNWNSGDAEKVRSTFLAIPFNSINLIRLRFADWPVCKSNDYPHKRLPKSQRNQPPNQQTRYEFFIHLHKYHTKWNVELLIVACFFSFYYFTIKKQLILKQLTSWV